MLLLDEPTSALDLARQTVVAHIVREFAERGGTVLMVTHQPSMVRGLADRVAVLEEGRMVAAGRLQQVLGANRADGPAGCVGEGCGPAPV